MRMRELLTWWWLSRWCPSGSELVRGGGCVAPSVGSLGGFHAAVVTREGECRAEAKDKWETKACGSRVGSEAGSDRGVSGVCDVVRDREE